ncbi:MAG: fumarate hydratase [Clostridia bacterium]|nr:fumarate hydratase [Clostridia bacterium]
MRKIDLKDVTKKIKELFIDACSNLPENVMETLKKAKEQEQSPLCKDVFSQIIANAELSKEKQLPLCQDTGVAVVFLTIGSEVVFEGDIYQAVNEGVRLAYTDGYLRKSVVRHPLDRVNTKDNTPAIVHIKMVPGDVFKIDVAPKGGGSENLSTVKMLIPADGVEGIKNLVVKTVAEAGGKPCPPLVIGVGIGGNFEKCALMAKEALLREIDDESPDPIARELEKELLELVNNTGVGAMGFGGTKTCLAVKVNVHPCHIASLPVAINLQCHSARHKSANL